MNYFPLLSSSKSYVSSVAVVLKNRYRMSVEVLFVVLVELVRFSLLL